MKVIIRRFKGQKKPLNNISPAALLVVTVLFVLKYQIYVKQRALGKYLFNLALTRRHPGTLRELLYGPLLKGRGGARPQDRIYSVYLISCFVYTKNQCKKVVGYLYALKFIATLPFKSVVREGVLLMKGKLINVNLGPKVEVMNE